MRAPCTPSCRTLWTTRQFGFGAYHQRARFRNSAHLGTGVLLRVLGVCRHQSAQGSWKISLWHAQGSGIDFDDMTVQGCATIHCLMPGSDVLLQSWQHAAIGDVHHVKHCRRAAVAYIHLYNLKRATSRVCDVVDAGGAAVCTTRILRCALHGGYPSCYVYFWIHIELENGVNRLLPSVVDRNAGRPIHE